MPDGVINTMDVLRRFGDDATAERPVAEVLEQANPIIKDLPMVECNKGDINEEPIRTGIPEPTWRAAYEGVQPSKSTTKMVQKKCGLVSALSQLDKSVVTNESKLATMKWDESQAHLVGMSNSFASKLFYGDPNDLRGFEGLMSYFKTSGSSNASKQVLKLDTTQTDTSALTSIVLMVLSPRTIFGIYPQGSKAGVQIIDYANGQPVDCVKSDGSTYPGYKTQFEWKVGLFVKDYRYAARLCNINTAAGKQPTGEELLNGMSDLEAKIQDFNLGVPYWYMNRAALSMVRKALNYKANVFYDPAHPNQNPLATIVHDEIPVHICDGITSSEEEVA